MSTFWCTNIFPTSTFWYGLTFLQYHISLLLPFMPFTFKVAIRMVIYLPADLSPCVGTLRYSVLICNTVATFFTFYLTRRSYCWMPFLTCKPSNSWKILSVFPETQSPWWQAFFCQFVTHQRCLTYQQGCA